MHYQDFRRAHITTGNGGHGSRGGDVGSHNRYTTAQTSHTNYGDRYDAPIYGSAVGGRRNSNTINDAANDVQSVEESQLAAQLAEMHKKIEAKRVKLRIEELKAELAAARAELGDEV